MEPNASPTETADRKLSELIVEDLVTAGLVSADRKTRLAEKIAGGKMTSAEWSGLFEFVRPAAQKAGGQ